MGGRSALGVALALSVLSLAPAAQAGERADRETLQRRLGNQGVVDLDRQSGTPRVLARLDGTLTRASGRDPEAIASSYVRGNLSVLGLTAADFDALSPPARSSLPGGVTSIEWRQAVDGIPSADHSLRVNVGDDGRVLSVLGAPQHALDVRTTTPALPPGEAVRAVQDDVGSYRAVVRSRGPSGATRSTSYGNDTSASLVTFAGRLAWRVRYRAGADAVYDATVDASSGDVLRVANMVKSEAPALVWERFPGNSVGGAASTVDLEARGWLAAGASTLNGPNVHAYSDLNDDDAASASEEVTRAGGAFSFPFVPASGSGCDDGHLCSWSGGTSTSWNINRQQDTVQAFYLANRFHDHLAAAPIGFDAAAGAFQGADALELNTLDGASGGPDADHANNANMFTPPDGSPPLMQMYLWRSPFRNVSSGSDAAILYHEYTHGLSNRLVTDADGAGALNTAESGAMGEAWSDWYAQDFIVGQFPALDTGASGEVVMGEYTDSGSTRLRTEPLDCPVVGADPVRCPGRPALGSGGYTYGDFGRISSGAEVHADGEIWTQTLWDLRTALGAEKARALVTTGMALLPPEPSFLDGRNGIMLADQTLYGGNDVGALWSLFAARGMGFFAAAVGGEDTAPAESFDLPPAADGPKGAITGRVTNSLGGGPVAGVTVGLAGLSTYTATTDADGRYTIASVPEGTYLKVLAGGGGYDSQVTSLSVTGGVSITYSPVLRRNWASPRGGAAITASNGREYTEYGCGPNAAVDQSPGTGWSTDSNAEKFLVVQLPSTIDVTQFALDPAESCGDTPTSATAGYRVETSPDGTTWTVARTGTFTSAARHTLNFVTPTAGALGVRYARLTLLSSQGAGAQFRDLAEFGVYGTSGQSTPTEPETTIAPGGPPFAFSASETATFECRLDDGAFAACTSPFSPGLLPDGDHTFFVRAIDATGNADPTPETRTFTVDTLAPAATILTGPKTRSNDTTPEFTFESEPGATFKCTLGAPDKPSRIAACTSPQTYAPLADDSYTFSVRATDAAGNEGPPATRTFTIFTTGPQTGIVNGPEGLTTDTSPVFELRSTQPDATFECKLDEGPFQLCSSTHPAGPLQDGPHTFEARSIDPELGNVGPAVTRSFTVDGTPPGTTVDSGPTEPVHSGPLAFAVRASDGTIECALDDGAYGSCAIVLRADNLAAGEHVYRARATDAAGNVSNPAELPFTVVNAAPVARLDVDADSGLAPHTLHATITATDADSDRLTYTLDFGDGETSSGALPAGPIEHRYTAAGAYTARLRVTDGRDPVVAERAIAVTTAQAQSAPTPTIPLSLALGAPAVNLGTFIPGVARDYGGTLTATTSGLAATLRVSDPSPNARGHLTSDTAALAEPLQVRATSGAFAPLDSTVTIPTTIEFKQSIGAGETLRPGTYGKTLTFTLSTTTP
jgi:extracellular elastinolytic metalloproteinase